MMDVYPAGEYYKFQENQGIDSPEGFVGEFYFDDVLKVLSNIVQFYKERFQLIYIDPPFMTGQLFKYKQKLGNKGIIEHKAYADRWSKGKEDYLSFMKAAFIHIYDLLKPQGSFFVHVDYRTSAYIKIILDDIFGEDNFLNEIIWHYQSGGRAKKHFSRKHDNILFYRKSSRHFFNIQAVGIKRGSKKRNNMKKNIDEDGRIFWSIKSGGKEYRYYEDSKVFPSDVWTDIPHLHQRDPERTGYDTQKPEALLERIILSTTRPGDYVGDFFAGSGTTIAVANRLDRRWVGIDSGLHSMHIIRKRLLEGKGPKSFIINYKGEEKFPKKANPRITYIGHDPLDGITLVDYEPHTKIVMEKAKNMGLEGVSCIEYWALGYIKDGLFKSSTYSYRQIKTSKVKSLLRIDIPIKETPLLHIIDFLGNQFFYSLDI